MREIINSDLNTIGTMEVDEESNDIDGIILSIAVKNFFCHENFEINLNRNVNYLVGRNGSGKSAFVSALVVGFGGKAAATNRGTSLTCFIKKGADAASVAIKIKNCSPTAYKPDVYGDSINVIHEFCKSGSSSYKVKSHTGKLITTKFQDVQDIAQAHNIQVDNPISVLNQDEARSFHSNDPKKMYTFFRKATNFDKTEKYYLEALELCKKAEDKWEAKKNAAKNLEAEYMKWKTLHERMLSRREMEEQKKALDNEYYWAEVKELERGVEVEREHQQRHTERLARLSTERDKLTGQAASQLNVVKEELEAAMAVRAAAEQQLEAAERAQREAELAVKRREMATRRLRDERARELRKLQDLRDGLQDMKSGANESARAEWEARAAQCEVACAEARARLSTAEHTAEQARQNEARARDLCDDVTERVQRLRGETEAARQQLRALQRAGSDSLAVFGPQMADLRRRVDAAVQEGAFSEPPRGPVGAYIKLRDRQWGSALEHILGKSVMTFCTNTDKDARKLSRIISEVYRGRGDKPDVSYSRFRPAVHDVSGAAVRAPGLVSAVDVVRVSDPVVANYLIDNLALETVLLVPDDDTAVRLTSVARNVPEHLRRVVTRDCAEFFPAPNYRSYGGRARPVRYLHQDLADRTRQVQAEVDACAQSEATAARQAEAAAAERLAAKTVLRGEERALQALRDAAAKAEAELAVARDSLRHHHAPTLQALEEELRVSEQRVKSIDAQLGGEGEEASKAEAAAALRARLRAATDELRAAQQRCRTLQEKVQEEQLKLENARSRVAVLEQRLTALRGEQERTRVALETTCAELDSKREAALLLCPPIENPRSTKVVVQLIEEARVRLRAGLGTTLSRAELGERLVQAMRRHRTVERSLMRSRQLIEQIKEVVDAHLSKCYQMQTNIVRNVQVSFECMLQLRNYTGEIQVNKGVGELDVKCAPRGKPAGGTSSLSGGERSYATVAFLMALWECVDLPFVFLDEFDVFMDNVNRKTVIKLLEDHAMRHRSRQFVFLTPQDGFAIRGNDFISIFRLNKA